MIKRCSTFRKWDTNLGNEFVNPCEIANNNTLQNDLDWRNTTQHKHWELKEALHLDNLERMDDYMERIIILK